MRRHIISHWIILPRSNYSPLSFISRASFVHAMHSFKWILIDGPATLLGLRSIPVWFSLALILYFHCRHLPPSTLMTFLTSAHVFCCAALRLWTTQCNGCSFYGVSTKCTTWRSIQHTFLLVLPVSTHSFPQCSRSTFLTNICVSRLRLLRARTRTRQFPNYDTHQPPFSGTDIRGLNIQSPFLYSDIEQDIFDVIVIPVLAVLTYKIDFFTWVRFTSSSVFPRLSRNED